MTLSEPKFKTAVMRAFGSYSVAFAFSQGLNVLLAIFIRNKLGPESMGIWMMVQVFLSYAAYSNLGLSDAAAREIPVARGANKPEEATHIRNTVYSFTILTSGALSVAVFVLALILRDRISQMVFVSLLTLSALHFFTKVSNYCIGMFRADKKFDFISLYIVVSSIVNAILVVAFVWWNDLYGYYLAMTLSLAFNFFWIAKYSPIAFKFQTKWDKLPNLIQLSVWLLAIGFLNNLVRSIDKIAISTFLGIKTLGVYSVTPMVGNIIYMFPNILNIIITPYLYEAYGQNADRKQVLKKYVLDPNHLVVIYLSLLIGLSWIALPFLVKFYLPEYTEGIFAAQIGMFSILMIILSGQIATAIIAFKRHIWMIPAILISSGIVFGLSAWANERGALHLDGVAWFSFMGFLFMYVAYGTIAFFGEKLSITVMHLIKMLTMIFYPILALLVIQKFLPNPFLAILIYCVLMIPMIWYGEKRFQTLKTVWKGVRRG